MKNVFKFAGVISLFTAIGLSIVACRVDTSGDDLELFAASDQDAVRFTRTANRKISSRDIDYWTDFAVIINGTPAVLTGSSIYGSDKTLSIELRFGGEPYNSGPRVTAGTRYDVKVVYTGNAWKEFTLEKTLTAFDGTSDAADNNNSLNNSVLSSPEGQQTETTEADFEFYGEAITKYNGTSTAVSVPISLNGQLITEIQYQAFEGKQLTDIVIPEGISIILERAFANNLLTNVAIPNTVTIISPEAFKNNRLTSIKIGENVELAWIMGYGDYGMPAFDDGFDTVYNSGGKKAGTYTLKNGTWELEKWRYFDLYSPYDGGFFTMRAYTYEATAEDIVRQLAENECLPEGSALLSFTINGKRGYADMNAVYGNALRNTGTAREFMLIGSLVNTLLKFFDLDEISLTSEGAVIQTGHVILDFPIRFIESY